MYICSNLNDTPPKTNTPPQSLSMSSSSYPSFATAKPSILPRPLRPSDFQRPLQPSPVTSSPDQITPGCMLYSPFSDEEEDNEQLNLTAPLIPAPPSTRKPPPPRPPAGAAGSMRSSDTYSSNSSQSSIDTFSATTTIPRTPPPSPPLRCCPKSCATVDDATLNPKSVNPPPLPTHRHHAGSLPDSEPS